MKKEEARKILEDWINEQTHDRLGEHRDMRLPITDEVVLQVLTPIEPKIFKEPQDSLEYYEKPIEFSQWSFKGLIKIAYDL